MRADAIPLSLYLHLPWCMKKCPYCDFNSYTAGASPPRQRYVDALRRDLAAIRPLAADRPLVSVFLGGGTPSLFAPEEIAAVLGAVREGFEPPEVGVILFVEKLDRVLTPEVLIGEKVVVVEFLDPVQKRLFPHHLGERRLEPLLTVLLGRLQLGVRR